MKFDETQLSFLDILIIKENNTISTDLYRKPTDRNSFLRGDSFHPTPLKKSLPVSQFSRVRRICSSDSRYTSQAQELSRRFRDWGYPDNWVEKASQNLLLSFILAGGGPTETEVSFPGGPCGNTSHRKENLKHIRVRIHTYTHTHTHVKKVNVSKYTVIKVN